MNQVLLMHSSISDGVILDSRQALSGKDAARFQEMLCGQLIFMVRKEW
jgi:hypothetical protein